jgi:hypothetical protein
MKAIETRYKGYRFRSRLEARWAVYFDALGVKWTYEYEGFELPNGTRYLPDFYLPDFDEYVEIKGDDVELPKTPSVYMAGKMKHPFRGGLGEIEGRVIETYLRDERREKRGYGMTGDMQYVNLGGAFAYYRGPHAFNVTTKAHAYVHGSEAWYDDDLSQSVADHCRRGIRSADAVVAYIDCASAYGTLVELGYAAALNKPILLFIAEPPIKYIKTETFGEPENEKHLDKLLDAFENGWEALDVGHAAREAIFDATWFASLFTGAVVKEYRDPDPIDAFRTWAGAELLKLEPFKAFAASPEMMKAAGMVLGGKKIHVFAGDPVENKHWRSMDVGGLVDAMAKDAGWSSNNYNPPGPAAVKARAARFEFGEAGA